MSLACNLWRIVRSVYLNLWASEFCFHNTAGQILLSQVSSLQIRFLLSHRVAQALVNSDTKWLNTLFLCDIFQIISSASSLILKHHCCLLFCCCGSVLNSPDYASEYFFPLMHTSSHLLYNQTPSSECCSGSFCLYAAIHVKFPFSSIEKSLDFNEVCVEKDMQTEKQQLHWNPL